MKETHVFDLEKHEGDYASWPLKTTLLKNGTTTQSKIYGYIIEAQYEHEYGFLLVTSWDCLYEESQTFTLLSPTLNVVYKKTIGVPYSSIWLENHKVLDDKTVVFHCSDGLDIMAIIKSPTSMKLKKKHRVKDEVKANGVYQIEQSLFAKIRHFFRR